VLAISGQLSLVMLKDCQLLSKAGKQNERQQANGEKSERQQNFLADRCPQFQCERDRQFA
jgi:hypothetical protein